MEFYREAKEIDFEKASLEFENMPPLVRETILFDYDVFKASKILWDRYEGYDYSGKRFTEEEGLVLCKRYMAYLLAKSDFRNNKKVLVGYL